MGWFERLAAAYQLSPALLDLFMPFVGGAMVLAIAWPFVRTRSPLARRVVIASSAASVGLFAWGIWTGFALAPGGIWLFIGTLVVGILGYRELTEWAALVEDSRESATATHSRQRQLERRAALMLAVFTLALVVAVLYFTTRAP